jgi:hypothetical protein
MDLFVGLILPVVTHMVSFAAGYCYARMHNGELPARVK